MKHLEVVFLAVIVVIYPFCLLSSMRCGTFAEEVATFPCFQPPQQPVSAVKNPDP